MNYRYIEPTKARYLVSFDQFDRKDLVEPGPHYGEWNLKQDVKSWLATNNIKVFVEYDCGDWGEGPPIVTMEFLSESDAKYFIETWSKK